jgi:hypothetical protein
MDFQHTLASLLVLHLIGLVMMAGAVLADFSLRTRFNKYLLSDRPRALTLLEGSTALLPLIGGGALLLILTGTAMVIQLKNAVTQMIWFRIKMPLVILLILNGSVLARRLGLQLYKLLSAAEAETEAEAEAEAETATETEAETAAEAETATAGNTNSIIAVRSRLRLVYIIQLLLFISIFILSIFKF